MDLINEKLAEIAREKDKLEAMIAERVRQELLQSQEAKALAENEQTLLKAAQILGIGIADLASVANAQVVPQMSSQPAEIKKTPQKWPISIGDAIEKALISAEHQLPLYQVEKALADMGVRPSRNSIRSTISQDKERFVIVEPGVYDLKSRHSEKQELGEQSALNATA